MLLKKIDIANKLKYIYHTKLPKGSNYNFTSYNTSIIFKICFKTYSIDNLTEKTNINLLPPKETKENLSSDHVSDSESESTAKIKEFEEYNKIIDLINKVKNNFDFQSFNQIITYIEETELNDFFIFKEFEYIVVSNIDLIDNQTLSIAVKLLSIFVNNKKLGFVEQNWFILFKTFISLIESLSFEIYYNFLISFDKIRLLIKDNKISKEIDSYFMHDNNNLLNLGKIHPQTLEDITLVILNLIYINLIIIIVFKINSIKYSQHYKIK